VTNTDFMKAFLSFAMSHGTWYAFSFIPVRKYNSQSINRIMCRSYTWNFTPATQQMRTVHTHTHTHTHTHSFMPLAEVQLSLCQLSQNTQSLSKFLQISLLPNLIHTNKIHTKYHLHCSLDYGFNQFCFQVSPLKL
jgi:hypothetical protein